MNIYSLRLRLRLLVDVHLLCFLLLLFSISPTELMKHSEPNSTVLLNAKDPNCTTGCVKMPGDTIVSKNGTDGTSQISDGAEMTANVSKTENSTKVLHNGTSLGRPQESSFTAPPMPALSNKSANNGSIVRPSPSAHEGPVGTSQAVVNLNEHTTLPATPPSTKLPSTTPLSTKLPSTTPLSPKLPSTTPLSTKLLSTTPISTKLASKTPLSNTAPSTTTLSTNLLSTTPPSTKLPSTKPLSTKLPSTTPLPTKLLSKTPLSNTAPSTKTLSTNLLSTTSKTVENPPTVVKATTNILPTSRKGSSPPVVPSPQPSTLKSPLSPTSSGTAAPAAPVSRTTPPSGRSKSPASVTRVAVVEVAGAALTRQLADTASLLAVLLFGLLFFLVTVAVFVTQAYESYRRKDYTQVDYLINGMYSDSGV